MRCRHCGTRFSKAETIPPFRASCPACAQIVPAILVSGQGDGATGFREIMIRQNANEPRRKLLETHSLHFVIFLDEHAHIVGFDLENEDSSHLYQWRRGRRPQFYGVANVGKGYHNRDEVYVNGSFDAAGAVAELKARGRNIRDEVRAVLVEGLNAYR